jgi:outer membrane protein
MFKKIVLFALLSIPAISFAQEAQKFAHVNYSEIVTAMPDLAQMEDSLKKSEALFVSELQILRDEYNNKMASFVEQQSTLIESIKLRRQQDLLELQERVGNYEEFARSKQSELYQALLAPIEEKVRKAIAEVGTENHITYIFDVRSLLFVSPKSIDATPLVKTKLGLK